MLIALTVHAERLFDAKTWALFLQVNRWLRRYRVPVTVFSVTPFHQLYRPSAEPLWLERLRFIRSEGHLVELHTHFYESDCGEKKGSLSKDRISYLVRRDATYLRHNGFPIEGFVAGGWRLNADVYVALLQNGFVYDCTGHPFRTVYPLRRGHHLKISEPFWISENGVRLLEMPTTASLSSVVRRASFGRRIQQTRVLNSVYSLVYLHDYDLLRPVVRYSLICLLAWLTFCGHKFVTTLQLASVLYPQVTKTCSLEEMGLYTLVG